VTCIRGKQRPEQLIDCRYATLTGLLPPSSLTPRHCPVHFIAVETIKCPALQPNVVTSKLIKCIVPNFLLLRHPEDPDTNTS
jgi:hypothetical protein